MPLLVRPAFRERVKPARWAWDPGLLEEPWRRPWRFLVPFWGGGTPRDLVQGKAAATAVGDPAWGVSPYGPHMNFDGNDIWQWANDSVITPAGSTQPWSAIVYARIPVTVASNKGLIGIWDAPSTLWTIWTQVNTPVNLTFAVRNAANTATNNSGSALALHDPTKHQLYVATWSRNALRLWVDGKLGAANTAGPFDRYALSTGSLSIGSYEANAPQLGLSCDVLYAGIVAEELQPATIAALARDPFGPFRPARRVVVSVPGGTIWDGAAALPGTGALTAAPTAIRPATAALSGSGTVTPSATAIRAATAALAGSGTLEAAATAIRAATVSLAADGQLAALETVIRAAAVNLAGQGDLAAEASAIRPGAVLLLGSGVLAADASVFSGIHEGAATLSGSGTLGVLAGVIRPAGASLAGAGQLIVGSTVIHPAGIALGGSGVLALSEQLLHAAAAALSASGALGADSAMIRAATAALQGSGLLTTEAGVIRLAEVILVVLGDLTADGVLVGERRALLVQVLSGPRFICQVLSEPRYRITSTSGPRYTVRRE